MLRSIPQLRKHMLSFRFHVLAHATTNYPKYKDFSVFQNLIHGSKIIGLSILVKQWSDKPKLTKMVLYD